MKKILGLDLGTNSIGWALIENDENGKPCKIAGMGSRIIPMDAATLSDFDKGNSKSQTAERTGFRGIRRIRERYLLRRERLHRILFKIGFLPDHYAQSIDFEKRFGQFLSETEPKIAWLKNSNDQYKFLFQNSFIEMLADFKVQQPQLLEDDKKVPYDWTIYFLRKKALNYRIEKEELAWIILNFNQKRGYYQLRGEDEDVNPNKLVEFYALKVVSVEGTDEKKGKDIWFNVHLENGWIYRRTSNVPLDWVDKIKEFIVTTDINDDGTLKLDKDGLEKRSFRAPKEDDWTLIKKKTESDIDQSKKTVGWYIYDTLLQKPNQKIKGKLVRTVERKFYKEELKAILEKQKEFHAELQNKDLFSECLKELYANNESHRNTISNLNFTYLFMDDIIFYQRPLKSKKSLISDCPYEERKYLDKETGEIKTVPVKCIAKSHPLFQEYRLWQFISNIRIYQKERWINEKLHTDVDVTAEFFKNEDDLTNLFDWLNNRKEIDQKAFLKYPGFGLKKEVDNYRWNYVADKSYPCNETRSMILNRLEKVENRPANFLSIENEEALWHILYSVEDKHEIEKALKSFAIKYNLDDSFVDIFKKIPPFKKDYGSYSAKAIKKLLPLMRMGKYWNEDSIDTNTKQRIDKILNGEYDEKIRTRVREKAISLNDISNFKALPVWLVCYIVYDRHSETKEIAKWEKPQDIDAYLKSFKQHSLRNPIVEQVITETLRTVRDIWKKHGDFSEIHVELGREMKNTKTERERISKINSDNENANLRIKALLMEFMNPEYEIENVRPYSPNQQEILRIYEDDILKSGIEIPEDVENILKKFKETDAKKQPSRSDVLRYKLWLEQKYRSPYTNEIIPLSKLFTTDYQIEHVIPQSRYFDDSSSNKVICESEVNQLKDNYLGYEFIKNHQRQKVILNFGKTVEILSVEAYEKLVKDNYSRNRGKMRKLLMEDIPDGFIERQLNDSRYISKVVKSLLSNIVREEGEEEATSKNLISCTGGITDKLKKDWGLNDVWNTIVYPRFERLNELTKSNQFGQWENKNGNRVFQTQMPIDLQKGFNKKRIDHRHHAMDALVIACATRSHVNYLNNEAAKANAKESRYDLRRKLRRIETVQIEKLIDGKKVLKNIEVAKEFYKPWETFTQDAQTALENIIVSFKQNLRVINKTTNKFQHFDENGKKIIENQKNGESWAIRKPMHKETVFGNVNLKKIKTVNLSSALDYPELIVDSRLKSKIKQLFSEGLDNKKIQKYFKDNTEEWSDLNFSKIEQFYFTNDTKEKLVATRKSLDESFTFKKIEESITDTGIQKILLKHLGNNSDKPELAFSPDGIDEMNRNIRELNDGNKHQPIYKVRVYETLGNKFNVGVTGNKISKFVEAAKGTNLFFVIYVNEDGKRSFETIPLNIVIERQKQRLTSVPETNEKGEKLLFWLSPNDLVYLPTSDEIDSNSLQGEIRKDRIYKMVSSSGYQCFFIPHSVANGIVNTVELGANNKSEKSLDKMMIKELCKPIKVDRLGNVIEINGIEI
ncbi:MAG: type II CRISPR RNA-guided endonuclease Cas9 [Prolixibacteraceae bacterium]